MAFFLFSLMLKPGQTGTAVWGRGELFPLGVFYAAAVSYTHLTLPTN